MILLAAATLALTLPDNDGSQQDSDPAAEPIVASAAEANPSPYPVLNVPVAEFDAFKVSGAFKVTVLTSDAGHRVRLQGPRALIADTVVAVENGTLVVRFLEGAKWSWNPGSGMNVVVWTPQLESIEVEGPASVEVFGLKGDSFAATTEGAGSVEVTGLDVGKVQLVTKGAGGISVEGSAQEATYQVGGAGSIDAMRLRVADAKIAVLGAGSSYANVSGEAEISHYGSGHVEVVGGGTCIAKPAKPDRIECR